ncbi:hypothetical protein BH18THE2_BH18THE2_07570 [soil metagenome]
MKQVITTIAVLAILLPMSTAMAQQQMHTFRDVSGRFTVDYPSDWKIVELSEDSQGSSVIFINPNGNGESLNVVIAPEEARTILTIGLEEYAKMQLDHLLAVQRNAKIVQNIECKKISNSRPSDMLKYS